MDIAKQLTLIWKAIDRLKSIGAPRFRKCDPPLTSTSWDGDAYSTTAKTKIDLSAVFSAPGGITQVLVRLQAADSGSAAAAANSCWFGVSPNDTAASLVGAVRLAGEPNDFFKETTFLCPCDSSGDIYFQCAATGASTMDVYIQIWGYEI